MEIRRAQGGDRDFVVEMAVLACGLDDRPLPVPDDEAVRGLLPRPADLALVAAGSALGAPGGTSTSQGLADGSIGIMKRNGVSVDVVRAVDHSIATAVWPDMTEHGWDQDE